MRSMALPWMPGSSPGMTRGEWSDSSTVWAKFLRNTNADLSGLQTSYVMPGLDPGIHGCAMLRH